MRLGQQRLKNLELGNRHRAREPAPHHRHVDVLLGAMLLRQAGKEIERCVGEEWTPYLDCVFAIVTE